MSTAEHPRIGMTVQAASPRLTHPRNGGHPAAPEPSDLGRGPVGRELHDHHNALFSALTAEERRALAIGLTGLAGVIEEHAARCDHAHESSGDE